MPRSKKSKEELEQFLAAPDTLQKDTEERKKAVLRKARLDAKEAQLAALKSKENPSVEDLLNDMVRVAEDEATNPWWEWRILSRKRYWLYGHYPMEHLEREFGEFNHALEVAGLRDQPGTRLKKSARAHASRAEHAARYAKRHVLPYVAKDADFTRELTGASLVLSISDTHGPFLDPFTWFCFLSAIKDLKPEVVLFNGDIMECQEISRFPKIPGWTMRLRDEFAFQREMMRQVREVAGHQGEIVLCGGNHDIDRWAMYLTQVADKIADLPSMRFDKLMGLADFDVKLAMGGTIASPEGEEDSKRGVLLHGFYRVHHGARLGKYPAAAELQRSSRSGQSGHCHRAQLAFGTSEASAGLSWMSTPCACTDRAARAYIKDVTPGWQRGFGVAHLLPGGRVHQYPVLTDGGHCVVEGYHYHSNGFPEYDVSKVWITGFGGLT